MNILIQHYQQVKIVHPLIKVLIHLDTSLSNAEIAEGHGRILTPLALRKGKHAQTVAKLIILLEFVAVRQKQTYKKSLTVAKRSNNEKFIA